jgi:hypothetical protein
MRVYRYIFKAQRPIRVGDIQRGLRLSSSSVAQYHVKKLLTLGLIREEPEGYVIEKVVFENIIRFRRLVIPLQVTYAVFFATSLIVMLTYLRPHSASSLFVFALAVIAAAVAISVYEAIKTLKLLE